MRGSLFAPCRDGLFRAAEPLIYEWVAMFGKLRKRLE
jgi:hypothetical protein